MHRLHISCRIGHDNSGFGGAWFLDRVDIDCPSLGKKWLFPCKRWLAKNKDDGALERELYPEELDTVEYNPCIRYEVKTVTMLLILASLKFHRCVVISLITT